VSRRHFPLWTVLAAVLVVALVAGSGVLSSSPPTASQRAVTIESALRCPSCEDLSVAESSAATAVTVRAAVAQLISEGRTDQQIRNYLVDRYGSSIVLDPPAQGWTLLVWLLPLIGGVVAVIGLAVVLVRRRRIADPSDPGAGDGDPAPATSPETTADRRRFLTRSLADADAEYLAGDLSDADYLALRHRDLVRLASLDARGAGAAGEVAAGQPFSDVLVADDPVPTAGGSGEGTTTDRDDPTGVPTAARTTRRRRSWWFLGGAVVAFGAALILAVTLFAAGRQPGQSITGSFAQSQQQQTEENLAQAAEDENQGQPGTAAQLYRTVLSAHPDNEPALAQLGWLEFETGRQGSDASLIHDGQAKLDRAVQLDPSDWAVRLYLGTVQLQQDGDASAAVDQYRQFLADHPPAAIVAQAAPEVRQAYRQAGLPLPSGLGA